MQLKKLGKADRSLSHGLSLLEEIPDRSCSEASIEGLITQNQYSKNFKKFL
jgi:hypothetical protein